MIDYNKLNRILHDTVTAPEYKIYLDNLDEVVKLAQIIVQNDENIVKKTPEYHSHININDSMNCVTEFFSSIKPEYADMFQNIVRERLVNSRKREEEYSVRFHNRTDEKNAAVNGEGIVIIDFDETIDDIYTISHEFIHKFSQPKITYKGLVLQEDYIIKQLFGEGTSIATEFVLQDYLEKKYGENEELKIRKQTRLLWTYDSARILLFVKELLDLYEQNGNYIDDDILNMCLENLSKDSEEYLRFKEYSISCINSILKQNQLSFYQQERYIIGTLLASHLHKQIKENPANMEKLVYLIDILGHDNHEIKNDVRVLRNLDIPLIDKKGIKVTEESYKRLEKSYVEEIQFSKIGTIHKTL